MKQKNVFIFFLLMVLTLSILIGCSNEQTRSDADVATTAVTDSTAETPTESAESANTESNAGPPADGMMGGMTFLLLSTEHPDLFAAELFVSCQWDISTYVFIRLRLQN